MWSGGDRFAGCRAGRACVVAAVVLGFAVGVRTGALAGVLAALAGFLPALVWELTRDLRGTPDARVAGRRKAALKAFVPAVAPPAAGGPVAGSPGEHSAAWYLRPEAQVVAFRPRPGLSQLREWCVAGGRQVRRRQNDIRLRRVRRQRGELHQCPLHRRDVNPRGNGGPAR